MLCAIEAEALKKTNVDRLAFAKMKMLRRICGVTEMTIRKRNIKGRIEDTRGRVLRTEEECVERETERERGHAYSGRESELEEDLRLKDVIADAVRDEVKRKRFIRSSDRTGAAEVEDFLT